MPPASASSSRRVGGIRTTTDTAAATIIQTRHRIPELPLRADQIIVFQVPEPEPLRRLEPREPTTRLLHALEDYSLIFVQLYEMIVRHGQSSTTSNYPVVVGGRYLSAPSPIPQFDNPKLDRSPCLKLYGAGREKRIYAIPPHTPVASVAFDDHPFQARRREAVVQPLRRDRTPISTRSSSTTAARAASSARTAAIAGIAARNRPAADRRARLHRDRRREQLTWN